MDRLFIHRQNLSHRDRLRPQLLHRKLDIESSFLGILALDAAQRREKASHNPKIHEECGAIIRRTLLMVDDNVGDVF